MSTNKKQTIQSALKNSNTLSRVQTIQTPQKITVEERNNNRNMFHQQSEESFLAGQNPNDDYYREADQSNNDEVNLYNEYASKGPKGIALYKILKAELPYTRDEILKILTDPIAVDKIDKVNQLKQSEVLNIDQIIRIVDDPNKLEKSDEIVGDIRALIQEIKNGQRQYSANGNFERMVESEINNPGAFYSIGLGPRALAQQQAEYAEAERKNPNGRFMPTRVDTEKQKRFNDSLHALGYHDVDLSKTLAENFTDLGNLYKEALWDSDFAQGFRFGFGNVASLGGPILSLIPGLQGAGDALSVVGDLIKPTDGRLGEIQRDIDNVTQYLPSIDNAVNGVMKVAIPQGGTVGSKQRHFQNQKIKKLRLKGFSRHTY